MHTVSQVLNDESTYSLGRFLGLDYGATDPYDSLLLQLLPDLPIYRTYKVRTLERRPELIAFQVYGTVDLYGLFMFYNGIVDHQQIRTGAILNCFYKPDLDDLISRVGSSVTSSSQRGLPTLGRNLTSISERYFK